MKFLPKLTLHEYIAIVATIAGLILAYQANKLSETQLKLSKSQSKLAELQARALEFKLSPYLLMKMNPEDEAKEKGTWAEISNEGGIALNLIIDSRVVVSVECYKKKERVKVPIHCDLPHHLHKHHNRHCYSPENTCTSPTNTSTGP